MGVGAASISKKKAENILNKFVKKGIVDNKQANDLIKKIMSEADKAKRKLVREGSREIDKINSEVKETVKNTTRKIIREGMKSN